MKSAVYVETTVIGYLATRVSALLRTAANQATTREWWESRRHRYDLFISRFVINECSQGDPGAAAERLAYVRDLPLLEATADVGPLARALVLELRLPETAATDAYHISVAAVNGIEYLLTWNCRHIANPAFRPRIERLCREAGYEPPVLCTPLDLLESDDAT